jgi:starvation-inducible DNA-binding protein
MTPTYEEIMPMGLHPTKNDLSESIRSKAVALLGGRLADCIDLQTQTKQAHWNVKGPEFIALHKLFDEINEAVEEYVDWIAERAVQLGGTVEGTAKATMFLRLLKSLPIALDDETAIHAWQESIRLARTHQLSV